jgi:hypothetical protein
MPRVTFHQLHVGELVNHIKDSRLDFCNDSAHSGILTGSLLPLLCSLLEQSYLKLTDGQDVYVKLVDIVPKIAASLQEQHDGPKSLHQYLKLKILLSLDFGHSGPLCHLLLVILASWTLVSFFYADGIHAAEALQKDCSRIVCYLKLLRLYFHDLLHEPIMWMLWLQPNHGLRKSWVKFHLKQPCHRTLFKKVCHIKKICGILFWTEYAGMVAWGGIWPMTSEDHDFVEVFKNRQVRSDIL